MRLQILGRLLIAWKSTWIADLLWCLRAGEVWVPRWLARRCAQSAVVAGTRSLRGDDRIHLVWELLGGVGALLVGELGILIGEAARIEHALLVEDVWVGGRVREAISGESVVRGPSVHGSSIFSVSAIKKSSDLGFSLAAIANQSHSRRRRARLGMRWVVGDARECQASKVTAEASSDTGLAQDWK